MKKSVKNILSATLRVCALLLVLPLVFGCSSYTEGSRPPEELPPENDDSIPVMGGGDQTEPPKKRVALTFDDGPQYANEGKNTQALVDELNKYGFHATFFVIGNRIGNGKALTYAVQNGNEIGIHAYTHGSGIYYDDCSDEVYDYEINKTRDEILSVLPNYNIRLMRPIGGEISPERIQSSPYSIINWDVDSDDWNYRYSPYESDEESAQKVEAIVENVMSKVRDGSIILMHDIYQSTYDAAVIIMQRLYEEGYEVVTVSELLGDSLAPGHIYHSAY
ncbi:MAG: polysaccharide deacetylase family protein [Clostridia bacterium]|nr:polysaccharide deacetylase family protein [Clostridia bacterium]